MVRGHVVIPGQESHGAGDMDKRVYPIEKGHNAGMIGKEEPLEVGFSDRIEPFDNGGFVFGVEHPNAMFLGHFDDRDIRRGKRLGRGLCAGVEKVVQCPVEHFDQERESLQDSAVDVFREARRVGGFDGKAETVAGLGGFGINIG